MARFGIVGASNYVGQSAAELLRADGHEPVGFSRRPSEGDGLHLLQNRPPKTPDIPLWIDIGPIGSFPERGPTITSYGARKILAISSTSRFTKVSSADPEEAKLVKSLERGEADFAAWCEQRQIEWVILRPTLIYGLGKDRNIREIAAMIQRFGLFPIFGHGGGRRQPIHAEDLARACISSLLSDGATNRAYNVSGGEVLTYREMVQRVFQTMDRRPLMPTIPMAAFKAALSILRRVPRFSHWTPQMAERMNIDMVFDHTEAAIDFGFSPRPFELNLSDLQ